MQAGKDVYVEKPVSHNIGEGRRMVQAARKYDRICQVGTQYRSDGTCKAAARFMAEGKLGKVTLARSITYKRRGSIGSVVESEPPASVDYDLWAGPAPMSPITRRHFHYDWHWFWEKEQFVGNAVADAMLTRAYRQPFVVPTESEV